jgi:tRNA acetyltransferase TAN1
MKGILVTAHLKKETKAMHECLSVFEEYLQDDDDQENSNDVEAELMRELQQLKKKKIEFMPLPKSIDCIRFCKLSIQGDPQDLVKKIISDLSLKKIKKTRFTHRIIPIQDSCNSHVPTILEKLNNLLQNSELSKESPISTFKIILKIRFNTKFKDQKDDLVRQIAALVDEKHTVDLVQGKNVVLVYVLQKITLMGIVSDYFKFYTFNLEELFNSVDNDQ